MDLKVVLEKLAQEPRAAGSGHSKKCADFIAGTFRNNGFSVDVQKNLFMGWNLVREPRVEFISPEPRQAQCIPVLWSGSTPECGVEGKLVYAGKFLTFEAYQWKKYAVVDKGIVRAYLLTRPDMAWMQSLGSPTLTVPYIIVDTESCKLIDGWLKEGKEIRVRAFMRTEYDPDSFFTNVIADGKNAKKPIVVSAHYDSMPGVCGAQDNASGVVALLALSGRLKNKVRLIAFDAEEWNKLGAYTYVSQLKEMKASSSLKKTKKPVKEKSGLDNIKLVINMDSVGAGEKIYVLTDKKFYPAVRKAAKGVKFPVDITPEYKSPQFDAWPFHKEGIPAIEIGTTPYAYFHKKEDTVEKINLDLINEVVGLVERIVKNVK